jgi:Ni/Fe-hydrogenase b-type cytochrome subunit
MTTAADRVRPVYEHPWAVRFCHWANAIAIVVLTMSGLRIFLAFPSLGPKLPQKDLIAAIPEAATLGGWLGGALRWHFSFMWVYALSGLLYVVFQVVSGHYRTVLFTRADAPGVWPMARHYLFFGPKPKVDAQYNPLQKLAYTTVLALGTVQLLSGLVMYKPAQLSALGLIFGGYHGARTVHFLAMCGILAFVPGHLIMVAIHGWDNFSSIFTGWRRHPHYSAPEVTP